MDSDEDDRDDALSVFEDVQADEAVRSLISNHNEKDSIFRALSKWILKFIKTALLLSIPVIVSVAAHIFKFTYEGEVMFAAGLLVSAILGYAVSEIFVAILVLIIRKTPFLGKHFIVYVGSIRSPLLWTLTTILVLIGYDMMILLGVLDGSRYLPAAEKYFDPILTCAIVTCVAFLLKSLGVRLLAIRFQRASYYKRIRESLLHEYVINCLMNRKPHNSFVKTLQTVLNIKGNGKEVSKKLDRRRRLIGAIFDKDNSAENVFDTIYVKESELLDKKQFTDHKLASLIEFIKTRELLFTKGLYKDAILRLNSEDDSEPLPIVEFENGEEALDISNAKASRLLARCIWLRLCNDKSEVTVESFMKFMNNEIALVGYSQFDGSWNGKIEENDLYTSLLSIARERKALKTALFDGEESVDRLDSAITATLVLILLVIYFIIFGFNAQTVLTMLSSFLLAIAFAVGSSAKALLESIIFIFGRHPFDVGDRVVIDKVVYTVAKVGLLTSELRRYDNAIVYFSNAELSSKPILNLRRSPDQIDLIKLQISFHTKKRQLRLLESKIADFLAKNTYHYYGKFEVEYQDIENVNRLSMRIWVTHRSNFQNMKRFRQRRGKLILFIKKACETIGIDYELPAQRVISDFGNMEVNENVAPGSNSFDFEIPNKRKDPVRPQSPIKKSMAFRRRTIYSPSGRLLNYGNSINSSEQNNYNTEDPNISDNQKENSPTYAITSILNEDDIRIQEENLNNMYETKERAARLRRNADLI